MERFEGMIFEDDAQAQEGPGEDSKRILKNKPRRNMSDGDMGAKRSSPFRRPSMSDVSFEITANPDDGPVECDLTMPYSEIVTIAGVSDIPQLFGGEDEELPPPPSMGKLPRRAPILKPKAVVSLIAPHKMLIVSEDFCSLFGYSVESEICGRAVKVLQGPRTDPSTLVSGIKGSALGSSTRRNIILYGREGNDMELEACFSPYQSGDESLAGCLLELHPIAAEMLSFGGAAE